MKKQYSNPQTICTSLQTNTIICVSVRGGKSQGDGRIPGRKWFD